MRCMSGCDKEGFIIKITPTLEVALCLDCMEIARKLVLKEIAKQKYVGARLDVTA